MHALFKHPVIDARRLLWRRSRSWLVAAVVALVVGTLAARTVAGSQQAAEALGPARTVTVAARHLDAGQKVRNEDVRRIDWPEGLLASPPADEVVGRVVANPILEGEPIVEARLAAPGAHGSGTLAPPGSVAVAVPLPEARPPLQVGDEVDVLAAGSAHGGTVAQGRWVARGAVVVSLEDDSAVVAVEPADAAPTAAAALAGPVALVLLSYR